jgi:hypothetical protein
MAILVLHGIDDKLEHYRGAKPEVIGRIWPFNDRKASSDSILTDLFVFAFPYGHRRPPAFEGVQSLDVDGKPRYPSPF